MKNVNNYNNYNHVNYSISTEFAYNDNSSMWVMNHHSDTSTTLHSNTVNNNYRITVVPEL